MSKAANQKTLAPLVTVVCIAYNQEKYIGEALDSFVMQQTDFPIEIIVHDDASTDKTPDIIRDYASKYPGLIKPVLRKKNQFGLGVKFLDEMFELARGKYIAVCEGDDYWTDPLKLQKQADFMEQHPDYGLCFHPVRIFLEKDKSVVEIYPATRNKREFTIVGLLTRNFIQTNSVMYRKQTYVRLPTAVFPKDWYNNLYHAQFGKIGFLPDTMADYRRHEAGVWWDSDKNVDNIWIRFGHGHLVLYDALLKMYGDNDVYRQIIFSHIAQLFRSFVDADKRRATHLFTDALKDFPDFIEPALISLHESLTDKEKLLQQNQDEFYHLREAARQQDETILTLQAEITLMKASRIWKARNVVVKPLKDRKLRTPRGNK